MLFAAAPYEHSFVAPPEVPIPIIAVGMLVGLGGFWIALGAQIQIDRAIGSASDATEEPPLIRTGLFRYIRYPSYAGQWLAWMGWPLIYNAPVTAVAMIVGGALIVSRQIRRDETRMMERYGEDYASYIRETDRLIPAVW
jgi:protein-S-isoprenylcysteine O-methyltransferase Ste14